MLTKYYIFIILLAALSGAQAARADPPSLPEALDACTEQGADKNKAALDACMSAQGFVPPAGPGRKNAPPVYVRRAALEAAMHECQGLVQVNALGEPDPKAVDICLEVKGLKLPAKEGIAHAVISPAAPVVAAGKKGSSPNDLPLKTTPVKTGSVKSPHHASGRK